MAAYELYVRGASANVLVSDLGFTVPQGPTWTMLNREVPGSDTGNDGQFTAREIRDSADLTALIVAGTLEWSKDGTTAETGSDYLADFMLMQDFTDDFLDLTDGRLALPGVADPPVSGVEGQVYWDNNDNILKIWNGDEWIDITSSDSVIWHNTLSGLSADDHTQYALLGGSLTRNIFTGGADFSQTSGLIIPVDTDRTGLATVEGNVMFDSDNNQLWVYDGDNWMSIPMMLSGVLTHASLAGLDADDHPQYHDGSLPWTGDIDVGGNNITNVALVDGVDVSLCCAAVSGLVTEVSGIQEDLSDHIGDLTIHFTEGSIDHENILNNGTNTHTDIDNHIADTTIHFTKDDLFGDDVTVSGLWTFNTVSGQPSIVLVPHDEPPTGPVDDGALVIIDNVLYAYDASRGTLLSVDRKMITAARNSKNSTNVYMRLPDGVATSDTGVRMMRDGTIVGLFAQTASAESWTFEVRRNGSAIASLVIAAAAGGQATNTNVDFSAGDVLQFFVNGTQIDTPVGGCEIAWRVEPA